MTDKAKDALPAGDAGDAIESDEDLWNAMDEEDASQDGTDDDPDAPDAGDHDIDAPDSDAEADASAENTTDTDADAEKAGKATPPDDADIDWKARAEEAQAKWESEKGRSKGQQKAADDLRKKLAEANATIEALKAKANDPQRAEALKKVKDEYGDVMDPVLATVDDLAARTETLADAERRRVAGLEGDLQAQIQRETSIFTDAHPNGFDFIKSNRRAFDEWVADQPKVIRDTFEANKDAIIDGEGAAFVLTQFRAHLQSGDSPSPTPQLGQNARRAAQRAGAQTTRSMQRQAATSNLGPDSDDPEAAWDYWERQDRKAGR